MNRAFALAVLGAASYVALFGWAYGLYLYTPVTSFWGDMLYAAYGGCLATFAWSSKRATVLPETLLFGAALVLFLVGVALIAICCLNVPDEYFERMLYLSLIVSFHRGVVLFLTTM
jgi:hypothetical protein